MWFRRHFYAFYLVSFCMLRIRKDMVIWFYIFFRAIHTSLFHSKPYTKLQKWPLPGWMAGFRFASRPYIYIIYYNIFTSLPIIWLWKYTFVKVLCRCSSECWLGWRGGSTPGTSWSPSRTSSPMGRPSPPTPTSSSPSRSTSTMMQVVTLQAEVHMYINACTIQNFWICNCNILIE